MFTFFLSYDVHVGSQNEEQISSGKFFNNTSRNLKFLRMFSETRQQWMKFRSEKRRKHSPSN
jgi:hypothetical protein